jgi:nitroreductase
MPFMDIVKTRFSVRKYLDKPVEREKLLQCLEAARLAPSACNAQPWRFIVVDDPGLRKKFADEVFDGLFSMKFATEAPVLVAIVTDQHSVASRAGGTVRRVNFSLLDLGIAGEHFVLQAAELGLGTCWIGWFNERAARGILGIPGGNRIACLLSVGYPADEQTGRFHRRKTIEEMSASNHWKG